MTKWIIKITVLTSCLLFFLVLATSAKAQSLENITSFDSQILASKDGQLHIVETIDYFFPGQRHGIFRTIPLSSKVGSLYRNISLNFNSVTRDGKSEQFQVSRSGINEEIKIGDPNQTITGSHEYKISYTVGNQIGNYQDHDEIYWNVTGNDWPVAIQKATAQITTDFGTQVTQATCFTGEFGSTAKNCESVTTDTKASYLTTTPLQSGEGMSVVVGFPVNVFPQSKLSENKVLPFDPKLLILFAIIGVFYYLALPIYLFYWYQKNHHKRRFGPPPVNFNIPKDHTKERIPPALKRGRLILLNWKKMM